MTEENNAHRSSGVNFIGTGEVVLSKTSRVSEDDLVNGRGEAIVAHPVPGSDSMVYFKKDFGKHFGHGDNHYEFLIKRGGKFYYKKVGQEVQPAEARLTPVQEQTDDEGVPPKGNPGRVRLKTGHGPAANVEVTAATMANLLPFAKMDTPKGAIVYEGVTGRSVEVNGQWYVPYKVEGESIFAAEGQVLVPKK